MKCMSMTKRKMAANGRNQFANAMSVPAAASGNSWREVANTNDVNSMNVNGKGISAVVDISMANGGSYVTATITPNLNSARLTLTGSIATPEESVVFKGRTF